MLGAVCALLGGKSLIALGQDPLMGLTTAGDLRVFMSDAPGTILRTLTITGLQIGEGLAGIDFRPADGRLYAIGANGATQRLYVIDTTTGAATAVNATPYTTSITGTSFGMDFNPVVDRIRVVSSGGSNLRVNPNNGTLAGLDTMLTPGTPNVVACAYTDNMAGATTTTLYVIDSVSDTLLLQGGINGAPSPNGGLLTPVGPLGSSVGAELGFDIAPGGTAYAAMDSGGASRLYTINLSTGAATLVGSIGGSGLIRGLAAAIPPAISINDVSLAEGNDGSTDAVFTVTLSHAGIVPITVDFATADDTAGADSDYAAANGTLTFAPGETSKTISVAIAGDSDFEGEEAFTLNLSNAARGVIADGQGVGTITNDDTESANPPAGACGACGAGATGLLALAIPLLAGVRLRRRDRRSPRPPL